MEQFKIKTEFGTFVTGFNAVNQCVVRSQEGGKLFKTKKAAQSWAEKHSGMGYGLGAGEYEIVSTALYTVIQTRNGRDLEFTGSLEELTKAFGYTLEVGESYQREKGSHKINRNPKNIAALVDNLGWAKDNAAANGYSGYSYSFEIVSEG